MNDGSDASETWLVALNPGPRKMKSYQDLQVWQKAMDLVGKMYRVTERLPREEAYGLTAQVRRSAISVPSNIAEGHARSATGDYLRHLSIAQGSLGECQGSGVGSQDSGVGRQEQGETLSSLRGTVSRPSSSQIPDPDSWLAI